MAITIICTFIIITCSFVGIFNYIKIPKGDEMRERPYRIVGFILNVLLNITGWILLAMVITLLLYKYF